MRRVVTVGVVLAMAAFAILATAPPVDAGPGPHVITVVNTVQGTPPDGAQIAVDITCSAGTLFGTSPNTLNFGRSSGTQTLTDAAGTAPNSCSFNHVNDGGADSTDAGCAANGSGACTGGFTFGFPTIAAGTVTISILNIFPTRAVTLNQNLIPALSVPQNIVVSGTGCSSGGVGGTVDGVLRDPIANVIQMPTAFATTAGNWNATLNFPANPAPGNWTFGSTCKLPAAAGGTSGPSRERGAVRSQTSTVTYQTQTIVVLGTGAAPGAAPVLTQPAFTG